MTHRYFILSIQNVKYILSLYWNETLLVYLFASRTESKQEHFC